MINSVTVILAVSVVFFTAQSATARSLTDASSVKKAEKQALNETSQTLQKFGRCIGIVSAAEKRLGGNRQQGIASAFDRFYHKAAKFMETDVAVADQLKLHASQVDVTGMQDWKLSSQSRPCLKKGSIYKEAMSLYRANKATGIAAFILKNVR